MGSPLSFKSTEEFRKKLLVRNLPPYNSDGFTTDTKPDNREFTITNISVIDSEPLDVIGRKEGKLLLVRNIYEPEYGYGDIVNINTLSHKLTKKQSYYKFIFSTYSPFLILISDNPQGSNGLLSQDSNLAQIAAKSLQDEFEYRVSKETYQQTLGRVNAIDALTDPFDMLGIITDSKSVVERDWHISVPESLIGKGLDFISRISGVYSPYSWIPGDYFNQPINLSSQEQASSDGGEYGNRGVYEDNIKGQEAIISSTGGGQKSRLFKSLEYNAYRPNYKTNFIDKLSLSAPTGNFYVGKSIFENELPVDEYGNKIQSPVLGYSQLGEMYENPYDNTTRNDFQFGLNQISSYDQGGLQGGFTWVSPKYKDSAAELVGVGGQTINTSDATFPAYDFKKTESTNYEFRKGSILDDTQRLINAAQELGGDIRLQHVGNAIDQISKVFNDGTRELTKGSRVLSYVNQNNDIVGKEYCRVFTKDLPFAFMGDLQKTEGITNENRRFSYSVLDKTYNLNIVPYRGEDSTNIFGNISENNVKKYMFSLENLAWRTSSKKGFTTQDLPLCERGPNGGRIMWFPPYDLKVSEQNTVNWTDNAFLGRPEPIYTYNNTSRLGTLSWKIVVDHPSILNAIVDKELKGQDNKKITEIVDSFFAGCRKYDIYELATRFPQFTYSDIYEIIQYSTNVDDIKQAYNEINPDEPSNENPIGQEVKEVQTETTEINTITNTSEIDLYFDNDIPSGNGTTSSDEYLTLLTSYVAKKNEYVNKANSDETIKVGNFFDSKITPARSNFNLFVNQITDVLEKGGNVTIEFIGSASSPATEEYNKKLSQRRIDTVKNQLNGSYGVGSKTIQTYINDGKVEIKEDVTGENTIIYDYFPPINCSTNLAYPDNIASLAALACRRVKMKVTATYDEEVKTNSLKEEEIIPPTLGDKIESNSNQQNLSDSEYIKQKQSEGILGRKKDVAKIIVKKLLTESDYFNVMRDDTPIVYDGIKEKIKYFHPVFHSTTPEGLNSRLTFLHQCLRPGDTIPVIDEDGNIRTGEATNTAFGAPPICVLRIGDFYHTKIAINQISINYEPLIFDLNPEGIGVQPMIADINMSFYFIGGQGLKEPVAKLQNALSFNYYANTEVYDERADVTEDREKAEITRKVWDDIENTTTFGLENRTSTEQGNDAAGTIGSILTTAIVDATPQTISGTTSYKNIMNSLITNTEDYVNTVTKGLENIARDYGVGGLRLFNDSRNYISGDMKGYFNSGLSQSLNLYGKTDKLEYNVDDLFTKILLDLTNETIPLMENINTKDLRNREIKRYKKNIENKINEIKDSYKLYLESTLNDITVSEQKLIRTIDKLNFILTNNDGYRIKSGKNIFYSITSTTDVSPESSPATNTYSEMSNDITTIGDDLNDFYTKLDDYDIVVQLVPTNMFNTNYDFDVLSGSINTPEKVRCYMVFNYIIIKNKEELLDDLLDGITNPLFEIYLRGVLIKLKNQYEESNKNIQNNFISLRNIIVDKTFKNYSKISKDKERVFTYIKDTTIDVTKENNYNRLFSEVNSNNNKQTFNGKITLN